MKYFLLYLAFRKANAKRRGLRLKARF